MDCRVEVVERELLKCRVIREEGLHLAFGFGF